MEPIVCGGWTEPQDAEEEAQKICDQVKSDVEKKTGKNFGMFKATFCRSQVVAGLNYLIKVHVGGDSYIHIKLFVQLPCYGGSVRFYALQENHTKDDPLELFPPF